MASFGKRASNGTELEPNTKRSCLKPSPAASAPSPAASEPSPASSELSPAASEPSPAGSGPRVEDASSHLENSDKLIMDLTADSDEDEHDVSCLPAQAVNIEDHYSCSELVGSQLLRHFAILGVKLFLVDHDYILCPYCTISDQGKRVKPSLTRVSKRIQRYIDAGDKRYKKVVEVLQEMDELLDIDTSERESLYTLANEVIHMGYQLQDRACRDFMSELRSVLNRATSGIDRDSDYRDVFSHFLTILAQQCESVLITPAPSVEENSISFVNWNKSTKISSKPDIIIKKERYGVTKTLAVIECKRYRELKFMFENTEIKDDNDLQKALPRVRFCKTVKKSSKSDEEGKKECILERMYRDLDASICRGFKSNEKTYFSHFLGQLVGEVLAWFKTSDEVPVLVPLQITQGKCIKYAVGQLGFKIIFVTVGINSSCMENQPHISIGDRRGMGLDVFITRPFDLMKADDRAKIRDILFVMMAWSWKPVMAYSIK